MAFIVGKKQSLSTYKNYKSKSRHVVRKWPNRKITGTTKTEIEVLHTELLNKGLKPKTANDVFPVVRGVLNTAFDDGIIKNNPLERIRSINRDQTDEFADPFTLKELQRIQSVKTMRQQDINMVMLAFWCGLSLSELTTLP